VNEWDGKERRAMNTEDHDVMIEIRNDIKHLVSNVVGHVEDDKAAFKKINESITWLQKITYIGMGGILLLRFLIK